MPLIQPGFLMYLEATAVSAKKTLLAVSGQTSCSAEANAERDLRQIFKELGYSLPLSINRLEHRSEETKELFTYHINPSDWVKHWMETDPKILGGYKGDPLENFKSFWTVYQKQHGSHQVFQTHGNHLERVIPLLLHGDEGRAVKRTNYFVTSIESPLGSLSDDNLHCSCQQALNNRQGLPSYGFDAGGLSDETLGLARNMVTNYKGHSYLSRFLLFGVGGWIYKSHPEIIDKLLNEVALDFQQLFQHGVTLSNGMTVFASLVSIKGDMDFHKKTAKLSRSYANLGSVNLIEICHQCLAGGSDFAFEDYNETPAWTQSLYVQRPWNEDPYFSVIPFDAATPERALQGDLMHVFKLGVGRDIVGGVVILLLRKGFFDIEGESKDIRVRFVRAHSHFALWCKAERKTPGLRSFSKSFFNMLSLVSAPWVNAKASDTILLLEWLVFYLKLNIRTPAVAGHELLLHQMLQLCESGLALRMVHHHPLWLERDCARFLYVNMMTVLRAYAFLGKRAIEMNIRAFIQKPKLHALHHLAWTIKTQLEAGATLIASPQMNACDCNEDFIGRISRLSRRVGFRMCDLHVCERYFLKVSSLLKKRQDNRMAQPRKTIRKFRRR